MHVQPVSLIVGGFSMRIQAIFMTSPALGYCKGLSPTGGCARGSPNVYS